jgi:hypothetical protein
MILDSGGVKTRIGFGFVLGVNSGFIFTALYMSIQSPQCDNHDYYSIWFNFSAAFFISEKKTGVIKLKNHFIHLVPCHEMLIIILNCWYIRNIIKYFLNNKIKN